MNVNDYRDLPDYLDAEGIREYFDKYFKESKNGGEIDVLTESLYELADRQWHTYELLDSARRDKIDEFLRATITANVTKAQLERILGIVAMLGLEKTFSKIVSMRGGFCDLGRKTIVEEFVDEIGDSIGDPFSGLKREV